MAKSKPTSVDHDDDDFPFDPAPRTSAPTVILCILNILVAVVFVYLLSLSMEKRRVWTEAIIQRRLSAEGLPPEAEDKGTTGLQETAPRPSATSEDYNDAYRSRKPGGDKVPTSFVPGDDNYLPNITPSDLSDERLQKIFGDDKQPVATMEAEVRRLKEIILNDINAAAVDGAKAETTMQAKRERLQKVLLPQAVDSSQILELDKLVQTAAESKLDELLIEAYERRMILDILRPVEFLRPGDTKRPYLDMKSAGDFNLKELKDKLNKRLDNAVLDNFDGELSVVTNIDKMKRDADEKRNNIAFLLFTIAHVVRPDGKTLLFERGPERTQTVVGNYAFATAARSYNDVLKSFAKRITDQIEYDRDGQLFDLSKEVNKEGESYGVVRTRAFKAYYPEMIKAIQEKITQINGVKRYLDLQRLSRDKAKTIYYKGIAEVVAKEAELRAERTKTADLLLKLQTLQARLFRAQLELSTAASDNEELAREIEEIEMERLRFEGLLPPESKEKAP